MGSGEGEIGGQVAARDFCELDDPEFELEPTFFSGEIVESTLAIRIQRGNDLESFADGLMIIVRDVDEIRSQRLGEPIELDGDWRSPVNMTFYLNGSCEAGFPNEFRRRPVLLEAVGGTIQFDAIYAPDIDPDSPAIEARLEEVVFLDPAMPEERHATLSGWFSFFYQRGAPAQRFP